MGNRLYKKTSGDRFWYSFCTWLNRKHLSASASYKENPPRTNNLIAGKSNTALTVTTNTTRQDPTSTRVRKATEKAEAASKESRPQRKATDAPRKQVRPQRNAPDAGEDDEDEINAGEDEVDTREDEANVYTEYHANAEYNAKVDDGEEEGNDDGNEEGYEEQVNKTRRQRKPSEKVQQQSKLFLTRTVIY